MSVCVCATTRILNSEYFVLDTRKKKLEDEINSHQHNVVGGGGGDEGLSTGV